MPATKQISPEPSAALQVLRELDGKRTKGPWCYESIGEKGDGSNIIGVAFGPDDQDCQQPLQGQLPSFNAEGKEIKYYYDETVAACEHRNRNANADAAFIVALENAWTQGELVPVAERDGLLGALKDIHDALDDALGDTDISHIESDEELREEHPVQWAAEKLAALITKTEEQRR